MEVVNEFYFFMMMSMILGLVMADHFKVKRGLTEVKPGLAQKKI